MKNNGEEIVANVKIFDKLINLVSGIGNSRDKTSYNKNIIAQKLTHDELLALYCDNWVAGKAVDIYAEDMVRKWRKYKGDPEKIKLIQEEEKRIGLKVKIADAVRWSRLYGGSAIIPVFKGDTNLTIRMPLDINRVKKGSLVKFLVVDRTLLNPSGMIQLDPFKDNFGEPELYSMAGNVSGIHHSRVFKFYGVDLPYAAKQLNNYWGDSIIQRMYETINNAGTTFNSVAQMMLEMVTDIIKIPNLSSLLSSKDETDSIIERFNIMKLLGSISQVKILDQQEEYERKQIQMTGVNDIITQQLTMVSASSSIPVTRFIGTSPRGMNATGESDLEIHYENVHSKQETDLRPNLESFDKIIQMNLFGSLVDNYSFEFLPLYMQDGREMAETEQINSNARDTYIKSGVLTVKSVAQKLIDEGWTISPDHMKKLDELDQKTMERLMNPPEKVPNAVAKNEPGKPSKDPKNLVKT
jgi:hypothetical protein